MEREIYYYLLYKSYLYFIFLSFILLYFQSLFFIIFYINKSIFILFYILFYLVLKKIIIIIKIKYIIYKDFKLKREKKDEYREEDIARRRA